MGYDDTATIPLAFDTASTGLYNSNKYGFGLTPPWVSHGIGKYSATPIIILGGASAVGSYGKLQATLLLPSNLPALSVIQLASLSGFSPVITTASLAHEEHLKSLGATHVLDRHLPASALQNFLRAHPIFPTIKFVYDAISLPETQQAGWSLLGSKGRMVTTLPVLVKEEEGKERQAIRTFGSPYVDENKELCRGSRGMISEWLEKGIIKVRYHAYFTTAADLLPI